MTQRQDTLQHEAAHAVGALLGGHRIESVRVGTTQAGVLGSVRVKDGDIDHVAHLVALAMGPLSVGKPPPPWPPSPASHDWDERAAAMTVHLGSITRGQYLAACAIADHYLVDHRVKAAIAAVAHKLARLGQLSHLGVEHAVGEPFLRWIESGT